jgi:hypothetical protein
MIKLAVCLLVLNALVGCTLCLYNDSSSIINIEQENNENTAFLEQSAVKSEINSFLSTTPAAVVEHVYTVNERETISLKCPIDFNNRKQTLNNEDLSEEHQTAAKHMPTINWYKDASRVNKLEQFSARYQIDGIYLKIKNVALLDTGKFKCVIVAEAGQSVLSSNIINLIVQPVAAAVDDSDSLTEETEMRSRKPTLRKNNDNMQSGPAFYNSIKSQPSVFYKQKGAEVRLRCRASGSPRPNIIWYKNGDLINQDGLGVTRYVFDLYYLSEPATTL